MRRVACEVLGKETKDVMGVSNISLARVVNSNRDIGKVYEKAVMKYVTSGDPTCSVS